MLTPRRKSSSYHHGSLRENALAAARNIVAVSGVEHLGIRRVADALSVTPAALYRHFGGIDDLRLALAEQVRGELGEALSVAAARHQPADGDVERAMLRLIAIGRAYVEFAMAESRLFAIVGRNRDDSVTSEYSEKAWTVLSSAIAELVRLGAIRADDAPSVAIMLWSTVHGCASLLASGDVSARERETFTRAAVDDALRLMLRPRAE